MRTYLYDVITDKKKGFLPDVVKTGLKGLSYIYGGVVGFQAFLFKSKIIPGTRFTQKVISVGNITWGGVGKTPLVQYVAEELKKRELQAAILTRGYMHEKIEFSDEAMMLDKNLENVSVLVGGNRVRNATEFLKENEVDAFILDDGFQHWKIQRDLDIVAIDALNPWGNESVIPRGILREKLQAIKRADIVVITKAKQAMENVDMIKQKLQQIKIDLPVVTTTHAPVRLIDNRTEIFFPIKKLQGSTICSFCSIGNPQSFVRSLEEIGADVKYNFIFDDHYSYKEFEIRNIVDYCITNNISLIVTTQKDSVKLKRLIGLFPDKIQLMTLQIKIDFIEGEDIFLERLDSLFHC